MLGISYGEGYRAITNAGAHGMQEVPHYHLHILGGRVLGRLLEQA
jgi:histidine triad (HIT) family protein